MNKRRLTAICLIVSLGATLILSGCGSSNTNNADTTETGQDSAQTGVVDPALAQPSADSDTNPSDSPNSDASASSDEGQAQDDVIAAIQAENSLSSTIKMDGDKQVVTNPDSIYVVVNKERFFPEGYEPTDLVEPQVKFSFDEPHEKRQMRKEAATALEELFQLAEDDGITLNAVSGYRSAQRQTSLYNNYVQTKGEEYANKVSAKPGTSEHQSGLTIDVSSPSVGNQLEQVFGESEEGKWLAAHAHEAGFIIRYPEDGESITGYIYEPWHIRYVGKEAAAAIYEQGTTLEQFLANE